jgi:hypothetical protein
MIVARQSTARTVIVGPVLDADGVAVTDGVVGDLKISKNGGAPAALNGSATLTHRHTGFYSLALTASDLDTVGQAEVTIDDTTNAMPMKELTVIEEAIYDAIYAASANAWTGSAGSTTLTALASGSITAAVIATGAIDADAIADNAIDAGAIAADAITAAKIADGAIDAATFAAGAITASAIAADAIGASELAADAIAEIADAVWDEDATGHQTGGTFGQAIGDPAADTNTIYGAVVTGAAGATVAADIVAIKAETADILLDTAEIGAAGAGLTNINLPNQTMDIVGNITGNLSGSVGSVAAGGITASSIATGAVDADAIAADAVTEIQSGLATSSALSSLETRLRGLVMAQGTIGSTGNSTTALHLSGLTYGDDELNDYLLVIFDVSESEYHARWVEDWADTGDLATVATLPFTPQNATDTYWLLPVRQDVSGGSGLDAAGVRAAVGLASANLDTQLGDLPTNAELATSQAAADDATLAAIAALNNLSGAQVNAEVDTALADVGLTTTITGRIDAAVSTRATPAQVNTECDTALADYDAPTNAEMVARTLAAADYATASALATVDTVVDAILADTGTDGVVLSTATLNGIADALLDRTAGVETSRTPRQALRLILAALVGKLSGAATTTVTIRDTNDSVSRVVATVDADGNRSSVTLNAS